MTVSRSRTRRRWVGLVCALIVASSSPAVAQTDEEAAERAAREIAEARKEANAAAEAYFVAESQLGLLEVQQQRLVDELNALVIEVDELRQAVQRVAVDRFVGSGATGIPILTDIREPTAQLHGGVLADVAAETGAVSLDDYEEARERLGDKRRQLDDAEADLQAHQEELLEYQAAAEAKVEELREIESQRLQSEAVQAALAAQQREEARQLQELQRRQAEANRARQEVAAAAAATVGLGDDNVTGNQGASGGEVGGRTGGGGPGNNPRLALDSYIDATMICPVEGASAYGDTWGAPRSGGRRHQGVDMLAPTGTPLVAVISGLVFHKENRLGGTTISLLGDNGNRYYYAHLSEYEGEEGWVETGTVIGYIGDTGNATGVPHLHFEIRPGGGVPVNPYHSVRQVGC